MEEKYSNFIKRTATTIIGFFLAFLAIFREGFPFFIVVIIIALLGLKELYNIADKQGYRPSYILGTILILYFIFISVYDIYSFNHHIKNIIITFLFYYLLLYNYLEKIILRY